jgi:HAD superfamily hydrolase (TIGR01459 family)
MTETIAGLSMIADRFDAFLVDQFGVLHDGRRAFDGAADCLSRLRAAGKPVAILSNSGKRAAPNARRLAALGFGPELYDHLVTSGEVARALIAARLASGATRPGAATFVLASDDDRSTIEGVALTETGDPAAAELLLILGARPQDVARDAYARLLAPLAARRVPCICANPDLLMYVEDGVAFAPGAVAQDYAAAGGPVEWVGKPHPAIFRHGLGLLGFTAPRVAMIGDSVAHDVEGAIATGCGWVLVAGGVQSGEAPPPRGGFVIQTLCW